MSEKEWKVVLEIAEEESFYITAKTAKEAKEAALREAQVLSFSVIGVLLVKELEDE